MRWKSLEAAMATLEAMSDDITALCEDDGKAGVPPIVNLGFMFDSVIPSLLNQSGVWPLSESLSSGADCRYAFPPWPSIHFCQLLRIGSALITRRTIPCVNSGRTSIGHHSHTGQTLRSEGSEEVRAAQRAVSKVECGDIS
jgi:hypothetical protein